MIKHVFNTVGDRFYRKNLHNTDWKKITQYYELFLPHINNNDDFAELLSEMLGELNASHTGSGHIFRPSYADITGRIGAFIEPVKKGIAIIEIMQNSPLINHESRISNGDIITHINGIALADSANIYSCFNNTAGKYTRLTIIDRETGKQFDQTIKPISYRQEYNLMYERWVERNKKLTDKLSNNRLGYVHIKGMNASSFRDIYADIMGLYSDRKGIVIDTRFNGGGWLHNELSILFNGKQYGRFAHRGKKNFGTEPQNQWSRKSILIVSEGNYSDAHMFPYAYRALNLGKIVGMPVPGTSTAVWWKPLIDKSLFFGIPQIGIIDKDNEYLENKQLEPDYRVELTPSDIESGKDAQLEKAIKILLEDLKQ